MPDTKSTALYTFILWAILIGFAGLTLLQSSKLMPLKGYRPPVNEVPLSGKNWLSGDYQRGVQDYLQEEVGLQSFLVRLHNQMDYSLFSKLNSQKVVEGKDDVLFESSHIDSYLGSDYAGGQKIIDHSRKLKFIQGKLREKGQDILVIIAPGKGDFYKEKLPEKYAEVTPSDSTNYRLWSSRLKALEINHIDFNNWFLAHKGTLDYPLYPRGGIHWSRYAESLVIDSIAQRVEALGTWVLPKVVVKKIHKKVARGKDIDIANSLNLLKDWEKDTLGYPEISFDKTGIKKPRAIIVADSYYWGLHDYGCTNAYWEEGRFWYYNRDIWSATKKIGETANLDDIQFMAAIEQTDLIIIMATEANLSAYGWGFINEMYRMYTGAKIRK